MNDSFPEIRFRGTLRPSQRDAVEIAMDQIAASETRIHLVAPPGSGKTVLGLYLWAECVRKPAVVLSPNSAIQSQWAARTDLFDLNSPHEFSLDRHVSTDPKAPGLLTSLTYQSVTLPRRGDVDSREIAIDRWCNYLIEQGQAEDLDEALVWIRDLEEHNSGYFNDRLSSFQKQLRDEMASDGKAFETLHQSALATLNRLRERDIGLVILDECHHLMGHWGRVLADVKSYLNDPVIIGLTATPPDHDDFPETDANRYQEFFGPIQYEVPVPAVVKDGFLAPYQDLAYLVRPTTDELRFIANVDDEFQKLLGELNDPGRSITQNENSTVENELYDPRMMTLDEWVSWILNEFRLFGGPVKDWSTYERREPNFSHEARLFLQLREIGLPPNVPPINITSKMKDIPIVEVAVPVVARYVQWHLRRSPREDDQELARIATKRLRLLGIQITETTTRASASPVSRVLAYSKSKIHALLPILQQERVALGEKIRVVVVTDYEKTSAVTSEISHLLDDEAGGAVAAFKFLLQHDETDALDPVLVTGSSVLVDDDLFPALKQAAEEWLNANGFTVDLRDESMDGFHLLKGIGSDWCPRVYVEMITELFQRGLTKCLVGTRGLLGEGWDANKVNVLIDLTTVTTSMTVNQLRGRSFRLDPEDPHKIANNWDVVCIAPEFSKGLDDYKRFRKKHSNLFGVTDDGLVEKGIGHVHPAFAEIKPEGVEGSAALLNEDMMRRVHMRHEARKLWKIGEAFQGIPITAVELKPEVSLEKMEFPPFKGAKEPWTDRSLTFAVGQAVLDAMIEAKIFHSTFEMHAGERSGGYVRLFLENAGEEPTIQFSEAVGEIFSALDKPRYVIPRKVERRHATWLSRLLPTFVGRYFENRSTEMVMLHAVPSIFSRNKELASIFQKHWNAHVSPGEAMYAYRGQGAEILDAAQRKSQTPKTNAHQKEVFL